MDLALPEPRGTPSGNYLHIENQGGGPTPLLLISDLGIDGRRLYGSFMQRQASAYRMQVVTLPSAVSARPLPWPEKIDIPARPWLTQIESELLRLVDDPQMKGITVVGTAAGGYFAARLALLRPQQVRSAVLVNALVHTSNARAGRPRCAGIGGRTASAGEGRYAGPATISHGPVSRAGGIEAIDRRSPISSSDCAELDGVRRKGPRRLARVDVSGALGRVFRSLAGLWVGTGLDRPDGRSSRAQSTTSRFSTLPRQPALACVGKASHPNRTDHSSRRRLLALKADMSERITWSPAWSPLRISMACAKFRPYCTCTFVTCCLSASSLNTLPADSGELKAGRLT